MKTTRATRRVARAYALQLRAAPWRDLFSYYRFNTLTGGERGVLGAMIEREMSRRARARNAAYNCGVGCPCGPPWSDECR